MLQRVTELDADPYTGAPHLGLGWGPYGEGEMLQSRWIRKYSKMEQVTLAFYFFHGRVGLGVFWGRFWDRF